MSKVAKITIAVNLTYNRTILFQVSDGTGRSTLSDLADRVSMVAKNTDDALRLLREKGFAGVMVESMEDTPSHAEVYIDSIALDGVQTPE